MGRYVAYQFALPPNLSGVHAVFHVSMLQKYTPNMTHVVDWGELLVDADGTFEEGPICIMNNEGVVAAPRSGGGNMGTQRHYVCQLSFLV